MNTVWVLVGLGIAGTVLALLATWRRRAHPVDLGAVSHQWIAEHQLGSGQDSRR